MTCCIRCGAHIGELDHGGNMICQNCESAQNTDVPCQRCGMYLPPHELRMWNSRLYCAYCIMDLQDEERIIRQSGRDASRNEGGSHGGSASHGAGGFPSERGGIGGTCDRCGRETGALYISQGRRLCQECHSEGESGTSSAPLFGIRQLAARAKKLFGIKCEPKIIAIEAKKVFDPATRKMVSKKEGIGAQQPLSDGRRAKDEGEGNGRVRRKKDPAAKKAFFFEHSSMRAKEKRGLEK
ncbi:MAG: hypothetical protein WC588_04735 [Candidatus Micrarchaeia archaeon]